RNANLLSNRFVVLVKALLGWLVVIGRDHQGRVSAFFGGPFGQTQGLGRAVAAGTGHDFDAAASGLHDFRNHSLVLVMRQCRRLTGRPDGAKTVRASLDLKFDLVAEGFDVELPTLERRSDGNRQTGKCRTLARHDRPTGSEIKIAANR